MPFLAAESLRTGGYVLPPDGQLLVNPASLDLRIADPVLLEGRQFLLASTYETVCMPLDCVGFVMGKSSWAREGLLVEAAGLVDPGFTGQITLELSNLTDEELEIDQYLRIAQIAIARLDEPTTIPYPVVGHYHGQRGPTPSWRSLRK